MKPTAYLHLYTQRAKKTGKYPVKVRVIYLGNYHDYKTGIDLTKEEFEEATVGRPKKTYQDARAKLDANTAKINEVLDNIGVFTFQKFHDAFYGRYKDASNIYPFYDEYIAILKTDGQIKTATGYTSAKNSLIKFKPSLGFYDVNVKFLKEYHKWLATTKVSKRKDGASDTTIGIYIRKLRTIYNYAISIGVIKMDTEYPFGKRKYVIPAGMNTKKALALDDVASIYNYKAVECSPEDKARDFWMFSYMCNGINFKDIALLRKSNIDDHMIRFVRAKTKKANQSNQKSIAFPITEKVKHIMDKWKRNGNIADDYLFDILENGDSLEVQQKKIDQFIKNTNKYIKRICTSLGINKNVTTYFSRHSAATIMKAGFSIELISESLGHSSTKTTRNYLDSFDDEVKFEIADKLTNF